MIRKVFEHFNSKLCRYGRSVAQIIISTTLRERLSAYNSNTMTKAIDNWATTISPSYFCCNQEEVFFAPNFLCLSDDLPFRSNKSFFGNG